MFYMIAKWVSISALAMAAAFWSSVADYQLVLDFVVLIGAIVVGRQALQAKQYVWAAGFVVIAVFFNPIAPVLRASGTLSLLMVLLSIAPFAVSLAALKTQPLLSMPSITDRTPGSQSL